MALLCRLKQPQLRNLSNQLKRCFFQLHAPCLLTPHSRISAITNQDSIFQHTHFKIPQNIRSFAVPAQFKPKQEEKEPEGPRLNDKITAPFVRLVLDQGHTIVSRREALDRAKSLCHDLVEVDRNAKPPVCKIMDYHREQYTKQLKEKERTKSKAEVTLRKGASKSVLFEGKIEEKDLQMKADTVKKMMESGYRVKCLAKANDKKAKANDKKGNDKKGNDKKGNNKKGNDKKGNDETANDETANVEMAMANENLRGLLARFCALIEDVAVIESGPIIEKKGAYVVVRHAKFGLPKKGLKKTSQLQATSNQAKEFSYSEADMIPANESPLLDDLNPTSHQPEASFEIENRYRKDPKSRAPPSTEMNGASPPLETENRYKKDPRSRAPPSTEMNVASPPRETVNRYKKDPRSRSPPSAETNVASPSLETENRYKKDPRNRYLPTETNVSSADPRHLHSQSPYEGRHPQQHPDQGRQPQQYPNQGRQPQYPDQGRQPQQYPDQGRQPQQYPNQGRPTQPYPNQGRQTQQYPNQGGPYPGASPNSSGQRYGVSNGPEPNSTTEPQPTVVNRYKKAVNQNSSVSNFHGSRGQGR